MATQKLEAPPVDPLLQGDANIIPQAFRYSSVRFLQVMLAIAWSAIAHPFSSSVIDLTTGKIIPAEEG